MAFPTVPTAAAGRLLTAVQADTTATRTFPNLSGLTKASGDLLIAIVVGYQSNAASGYFSGWTAGWTEFVDAGSSTGMCIGAAYKWSTGSETGTISVTQVATITGHAAMVVMAIPGAHASTPPEGGAIANGTSAAADPGALDPAGWAAEDALWIAVAGSGETSLTGSYTGVASAPTNYTDYAETGTSADAIGAVEAAVAFRQLNAASEDVGAFSVDTSNARNSALLISVRPAAALPQTVSGGVAPENDSAPTGSVRETYSASLAAENESALVGQVAQLYTASPSAESDSVPGGTVQQASGEQTIPGGIASEDDSVPAASIAETYTAGAAAANELVASGKVLQLYTAAPATENGSVASGQVFQTYTASPASESSTIPGGQVRQVYTASPASEQDAVPAGSLEGVPQNIAGDVAPESDSSPAGATQETYTAGPVSETNTAPAGTAVQFQVVFGGAAQELDAVLAGVVAFTPLGVIDYSGGIGSRDSNSATSGNDAASGISATDTATTLTGAID